MATDKDIELRQKKIILAAVLVALMSMVGVIVYRHFQQANPTTTLPDHAALSVTLGDETAAQKVVVYTDPACDKCGAYRRDTLAPLYEDYVKTGKVALEIRPVSIVTEQSALLNTLLMCANEQGKFWQMSDFVSTTLARSNGKNVSTNATTFFDDYEPSRLAVGGGVNETKLTDCLKSTRYNDQIKQADTQAYAANIYSAPTTFVGDREPVRGYAIYSYIKSLIDLNS